ncbi:MAG: CrcB family protein [Rhodospirillales bacterium]|nr:CrcB family protein [Rhodospirillales bacterium]
MSAKLLMSIAAGGALGAVSRYVMFVHVDNWLGSHFPFSTLIVNVVGAVAMGSLVALTASFWSPSDEVRAFLSVGMLGAFTTFSLFSQDLFNLMERGDAMTAVIYAAMSVVLCILGFYGGYHGLKHILT